VWVIAAVFVALELALSGRYGFMQDELYFIEAGRHLAFGYADQPPLTPLVDRIMDLLFGVTPTAVRVVPALAGGAVVVLAARYAALFGAGRLGRVIAALLTACSPVLLGSDHLSNTTPLDLLTWPVVALCVAVALLRDRPRWWLGGGVAAGIGLENDNLMLLLSRWPLPALSCSGDGRICGSWRVASTLIVAYVLTWVPGKSYYSVGIAPELLAAGSVATERWIARARRPRLRTAAVAADRSCGCRAAGGLPRADAALPSGGARDGRAQPAVERSAPLQRRRHHWLAAARQRGRRAGRRTGAGRPAAYVDIHRGLRGNRCARCPRLRVPPAAGAVRP
jgi:hypothetical protein